jgi:hypothetical protein
MPDASIVPQQDVEAAIAKMTALSKPRQVGRFAPASCSRGTAITYSSVNLARFIVRPSSKAER